MTSDKIKFVAMRGNAKVSTEENFHHMITTHTTAQQSVCEEENTGDRAIPEMIKVYEVLATLVALCFAPMTGAFSQDDMINAIRFGRCDEVEFYLSEGQDPNQSDSNGKIPLEVAAWEGKIDCVIALRDHGAYPLSDRWRPYFYMPEAPWNGPEAMLLAGVDPVDEYGRGWTGVGYSAYIGCLVCLKRLLSEGDTTEGLISSRSSETPLITASQHGHLEIVRELLKRGANVTATDSSSAEIALHKAAAKGYVDIARLLIAEEPASINRKDNEGKTPLHYAAEKNHPAMVRLLLQRGADGVGPSKDNEGKTPLDLAYSGEVRRLLSD